LDRCAAIFVGSGRRPASRRLLRPVAAVLALVLVLALGVTFASATAPVVTIENASGVSFSSAHVKGHVNPEGQFTEWRFQYATEADFSDAVEGPSSATESDEDVSGQLSGLAPGTTYHLRLLASNGDGQSEAVAASTFTTEAVNPPAVSGLSVSGVGASSAHFQGTVNSGGSGPGEATEYAFQCSPECPGIEGLQPLTSDGADHLVEADASGLEPNREYTVTLRATDAAGLSTEESGAFTTGVAAPELQPALLADPTATSIGLNAYLNPHNSPVTECQFEWGPTAAYGHSIPCLSLPSGNQSAVVSADLSGLQPATEYHFRASASNGVGGSLHSSDRAFSTFPAEPSGPCPNEEVRQEQGSTYLPDCRAYELVSSSNDSLGGVANSDDGSRVSYDKSNVSPNFYTATRDPSSGWQESSMQPPADQLLEGDSQVFAYSGDRSKVFLGVFPGVVGLPTSSTIVRLAVGGVQSVFAHLPSSELHATNLDTVASDDGAHAFAAIFTPFDSGHLPGTRNVYDLAQNPPLLVSRMPDGSVCGITASGFASQGIASTELQHWNSTDGSRVFFLSNCGFSGEVLFRRDLATQTTTQISGTDADATFVQAAADGQAAIFTTTGSLTPQDTNADRDVYLWTASGGNQCLTCVVPDAEVDPLVAAAPDLSRAYFSSSAALTPDDVDGTKSLYVLRIQGGVPTTAYVSPLDISGNAAVELVNDPQRVFAVTMTGDGSTLVFRTNLAALNPLTQTNNGGRSQFYRYDDRARTLTCVSCPATGGTSDVASPSIGSIGDEGYSRVLSDDGSRFFFRTNQVLVPRDVNAGPDIYEWHDSRLFLISDGVDPTPGTLNRPSTLLRSVSADGRDVFITSLQHLTSTPGAGSMFLYDVRADGGFPAPRSTPCSGEGCQGETAAPPAQPAAASAAFAGPGNPKPRRKHKRHHRRKHHGRTANHNRRVSR
jgi:hypothetical protein